MLLVFVVHHLQKVGKKQNNDEINAAEEEAQYSENDLQDFKLSWLFKVDDILNFMIELLVLNLAASFRVNFEVVFHLVRVFAILAHWKCLGSS